MIAVSALWSLFRYRGTSSPDLMATWLAGHFYGLGQFDQVYPSDLSFYTMNAPSGWWPYLQSLGYSDSVFPFIYPPIWAAMMAQIARLISFDQLQFAVQIVNPVLLGLTIVLAARIIRTRIPAWAFLAIGLAILHFTLFGIAALAEDQPQILVSFLIILGIERQVSGRPWQAGAVMALAAAIKLYPLFFALIWVLRRQYKPALVFVLVGGILAATSVAVAGWPLHQAFLNEVRVIGATAFSNKFVFSIDPMIARIFMPDQLTFIPATGDVRIGWEGMEKTALWRWASLAALLISVFACARIRSPMAWPILAVLIGLFSPLSWGYHYITAVAFAPALLSILGHRAGILVLLAIFMPFSEAGYGLVSALSSDEPWLPTVGTIAMAALGLAFGAGVLAAKGKKHPN